MWEVKLHGPTWYWLQVLTHPQWFRCSPRPNIKHVFSLRQVQKLHRLAAQSTKQRCWCLWWCSWHSSRTRAKWPPYLQWSLFSIQYSATSAWCVRGSPHWFSAWENSEEHKKGINNLGSSHSTSSPYIRDQPQTKSVKLEGKVNNDGHGSNMQHVWTCIEHVWTIIKCEIYKIHPGCESKCWTISFILDYSRIMRNTAQAA